MDLEQQLQQAKQERENYVTRIFWLGFEIALIFGVPAAAAALAGVYVFNKNFWLVVLLVVAFVISWIVVIIRYQKISRTMKQLDEKVRRLQEQHNQNSKR